MRHTLLVFTIVTWFHLYGASCAKCAGPHLQREGANGFKLGSERLKNLTGVKCLAFSPDDTLLASGGGLGNAGEVKDPALRYAVRLWCVSSGAHAGALRGHTNIVTCLAFSPCGSLLASGSDDKTIRVWDVKTRKALIVLKDHPARVRGLLWVSRTLLISSHVDSDLSMWDLTTPKELGKLTVAGGTIWSMSLSPAKNRLALGLKTGSLVVVDLALKKVILERRLHKEPILNLAFLSEGKIQSVGWDNSLAIFDFKKAAVETRSLGEGFIRTTCSSVDGGSLLLGKELKDGNTASFWDSRDFKWHQPLGRSWITASAISAGKRLVALGNWDGIIRIVAASDGVSRFALGGHSALVTGVGFLRGGTRVVSGSWDGTIRLWDINGKLLEVRNEPEEVTRLCVSADGKYIAFSLSGRKIKILEREKTACYQLVRTENRVSAMTFIPNADTLVWGDDGGKVWVYEHTRKRLVFSRSIAKRAQAILELSCSPDGKTIGAIGDAGSIAMWRARDGTSLVSYTGEQKTGEWCGGTIIVSGSERAFAFEGAVLAWDLRKKKVERIELSLPFAPARSAFSSDGKLLALHSGEGRTCVFELVSGQKVCDFLCDNPLESLMFSPTGQFLVLFGGGDYGIWFRDISGAETTGGPSHEQLAPLWGELGGEDSVRANKIQWLFVKNPQEALRIIEKKVAPIPVPSRRHVAALLAQLGSKDYRVRDEATSMLKRLGEVVLGDLEEEQKRAVPLEVQQRLLSLVKSDELRKKRVLTFRLIRILELIGDECSDRILARLAQGSPNAWLTIEARSAIERMAARKVSE
jgi:WD40 repeat protein